MIDATNSKTVEMNRYKAFLHDFGDRVFIVIPVNGEVPKDIEKKILAERDLLLQMRPK